MSATPIRTKNINWEVNFNFAFNAGIVQELPANGELKNRTGGNVVYNKKTKQYERVGGLAEGNVMASAGLITSLVCMQRMKRQRGLLSTRKRVAV